MRVELIYDSACPNVAATRANLLRAFAETRLPAKWTEWERSSPDTPVDVRPFGSPAILVNGKDIAGYTPNAAPTCRIYLDANGAASGVPSLELISQALKWSGSGVHVGQGKEAMKALDPGLMSTV